ncbi:WcaF family extracellular polysaccharide biosynthesis acetyltransferase [Ferruginibacter lapsinanis]|uniref:WcaF family extracellular polysaccharide biosynthesis acetyltransferase n=1 Tax=Ferruginibacter lapsinanis TaxID=563172 RepID=UPI001E2DE6A5|nr:WcaF family extracellular polysaccharide biosynthesis acetyltransferase [Ferruginibacter lapsinanis]UEG49446.1 WcaF family extracellular polysaccharide biosynthesis acetyltransferase [Ferruginibacter lapsinanis]
MSNNKTVNNASFVPTLQVEASLFKQVLWYFTNILFFKNPLNPSSGLKKILLKLFGAKVGNGVVLKPAINIKFPWKLSIGDYSWIGENVWIDNLAKVSIGSNVCISQGAYLLTGNHNYKKTTFDLITAAINIEDGVWIGAKAIVCPGVTCKTHAILSVASIASKDLEPYSIYKGNPAIKINERIIG